MNYPVQIHHFTTRQILEELMIRLEEKGVIDQARNIVKNPNQLNIEWEKQIPERKENG